MKSTIPPKDKLFQVAARLFYQHGYRATGVDTIAGESGIGKMTLYRHYPSKDDLIAAYLLDSDMDFWSGFEAITAGVEAPRDKLLAFFEALQDYALSPTCYGCPFLNVATEYPQPGYVGHVIAVEHKVAVRGRFLQLAEDAGVDRPETLADGLVLLMDGAYMAARLFNGGPNNPATHLAETARALINAHCLEGKNQPT